MSEMKKEVCVPVVDGRILENATGSNGAECAANLDLVDLTDEELQRVEFRRAILSIVDEGDNQ